MVFIVAHRGASAYALENTLDAFQKAIEMGASYIECDIRVSKDNKLVVIHDANLRRVFGIDANVNELTAEQLKQYKIPTLEEVLDLIKKVNKEVAIKQRIEQQITIAKMQAQPQVQKTKAKKKRKVWLLIEIKEPGCEEKLAELIKEKGMTKSVVVVSFFDEPLKKIKQLIAVKTGFIFSLLDPDVAFQKALDARVNFIIPRYDVVSKDLVKRAHKQKLKVVAWTVDDVKIAKELIKLKVDGITSNKPDLLQHTSM
jgi:glycerophosphoryl diester phosphodiesterase